MSAKANPKFSPAECEALYNKAHEAGMAAGGAHKPKPMIVYSEEPVMGDPNVTKRHYYPPEPDGVCGFAWVKVRPGNGSFANYLKKAKGRSVAYGGGVDVWVSQFDQSMEKKEAYAAAFAKVLQEAGINAYSDSRMD